MTLPEFERALAEYELHAPVTMADLAEIREDIKKRAAIGLGVEVVLRGTPDRKHDGDHRVEVTVYSVARADSRSIPVLP